MPGLAEVRLPQRKRARRVAAAAAVLLVGAGVALAAVVTSSPTIRTTSQLVAGTPEAGATVGLDTTVYFPATTPAPAVLLAHGFGGSKSDLDSEARSLAEHGYVVLAYTARGFGQSGGLIHLDAPSYEVADAGRLVSYLATLPQVVKDAPGDPRVGVAGSSYGGGLALLLGANDKRVDAIGADITWNDLSQALFPNAAGGQPARGFPHPTADFDNFPRTGAVCRHQHQSITLGPGQPALNVAESLFHLGILGDDQQFIHNPGRHITCPSRLYRRAGRPYDARTPAGRNLFISRFVRPQGLLTGLLHFSWRAEGRKQTPFI